MFEKWKLAGSVALMTASLGLFAASAHASLIYSEVPDAGHTFVTAQSVNAAVDQIVGNLDSDPLDFADLFWIQWGGGDFQAETTSADFDTELFLWDATQSLLAFDDDSANNGAICDGSVDRNVDLCSLIFLTDLAPGHYFLGVGVFDIFADLDGVDCCATGRGTRSILVPGAYVIQLNALTVVKVFEPSTLAIFAIGLIGLGFFGWRRRTA